MKAFSTLIDALADVSMNRIPYSNASCSPLSFDTYNKNELKEVKKKSEVILRILF